MFNVRSASKEDIVTYLYLGTKSSLQPPPIRCDFSKCTPHPSKKILLSIVAKRIHRLFKKKVGLIIDVPKPGYGTTNDGNSARRFFSNPKLSAKITGKRI